MAAEPDMLHSPAPAASSAAPELAPGFKWYRGLDRYCWIVLWIAALGWLFDTLDQNLFNLVRQSSLRDLLARGWNAEYLASDLGKAELLRQVTDWGGRVMAFFLVGWATGGFIFGVIGDRLGRTRTMMITILMYALFTGLSAFANNLAFYAIARFLTGMGVGGEFAAGAALVAETFPERSRPMALGLLQALSTVGNMGAAVITMIIGDQEVSRFVLWGHPFNGWRIAYLVGAAPALLVLWIRASVREPEKWQRSKARGAAGAGKPMGNMLELFTSPALFRRAAAGCLIAMAGVGTLWGVGNYSVDIVRNVVKPTDARFISYMFLLQQVGGFLGIYCFALAAERFGRRPAFIISYCLTFITIVTFFWTIQLYGGGPNGSLLALLLAPMLGFGTLAPFGGFSIYFPELFPTRLRATGAGFCYNAARFLSAGAPFVLGTLAKQTSYAHAATVVGAIVVCGIAGAIIGPETKGKPLPEDL